MKNDIFIGTKLEEYYHNTVGRKHGYITNKERAAARKRNRKKKK